MTKSKTEVAEDRLLLSRKDAAALLGVNPSYIQSLEKAGRLKGLRLSRSATAMVYFKKVDLLRLVNDAAEESRVVVRHAR